MSNTRKKPLISTVSLAFFAALASDCVWSQGDEASDQSFAINKVLVSATRTESNVSESGRAVSVVEKSQLEVMQPQSVAQAVRYETNVTMSGGPRSGSQGVNIRGLSGSKVLQVVDGVRQVFESGHRPSYFLDPEMLKSVEVVKGPASTLWGSGALGGVVAQNTISAADLLKPSQDWGGFIKTSFNANNDKQTYVSALAGRTETLDWLLNGYFRDSNDLKQGNDQNLENSGKRDHGVLAKTQWQIDENQGLNFVYRQSNEAGEIPSNGEANLSSSVFLIDRDTDTQNAALEYELNTESDHINALASVYWNHIEMEEARVSDGRGDSTELDVLGLSLQNSSVLDSMTLLYGVDGYSEDFSGTRDGANRPLPPEANTKVWGAYVSANVPLSETFQWELGARYDRFETEAENLNNKASDDDVSPSIALIWQASDALQLTLRHDRAFRAPSSEELYTNGTHFCMGPGMCNTFLSNPDLEPEKAANTELLARVEFEPNEQGGQWYVESSVFENKVDNFIEQIVSFSPFPGNTTWVNVEKATIKGAEVATTYIQDALTLKLSYGQTRGKDKNTNEYLSNIPADKKTIDASYAWADRSITSGLRVTDVDAQNRVNNGADYAGYTIADLYASWSPKELSGVKLDLAVNNLTDRYFRQAWQELYEPGREVIVSAKYSF